MMVEMMNRAIASFAGGLGLMGLGIGNYIGLLRGHVSIGPLTPAEKVGVKPKVPPRMYRGIKIIVLSSDGKKELKRIPLNDDGDYSVSLASGSYQVTYGGMNPPYGKPKP